MPTRSLAAAAFLAVLSFASSAFATRSSHGAVVKPGGSIQAAVDAANPGDTITVLPGTYREAGTPCPTDPTHTCAVVVTKANIHLVGLPFGAKRVVLENAGNQDQGIAIAPTGVDGPTCLADATTHLAGASVSGFTVNGFGGEGIFLFCVDGFSVTFNAANDNAEYGIFPSHASKGTIALNVVTGSNDTGIYIGQSSNVDVSNNFVHGNVSGFEIENCSNVRLHDNASTGNTGGILSFTLPFLDVKQNTNNRIDHNWVQGNNKANTCVDPTDEVCGVPVGTGILALAVDDNRIDHNVVLDNDSYGIAVANFCLGNKLPSDVCAMLDIDPNPDNNQVDHNAAFGNGKSPSPLVDPVFGDDLAWDGSGTGNCWSANAFKTSFPEDLPTCP
ncbi:MAG TPA: right-handed parallel beta-helix repeat-containing protein [Myxococcota bacterium]|nr:right-handed parallel beta-helix repeat-containing protein [Myxococcota bacterium]